VAKMTPEQEASYALDHGVSRVDLSPDVQAAHDRLREQRAQAQPVSSFRQQQVAGEPGRCPNCGRHAPVYPRSNCDWKPGPVLPEVMLGIS
jgi:hypothetical protein